MSVLLTNNDVLGPFKSITVLADRLHIDGADYPFNVLGSYTISEDDSLAPAPPAPMPTEAEYTAALESMYDAKAKERRYDSRITCALRAGYAGPFRTEGAAFAIWMDTCNATAYTVMGEVLTGTRAQPTIAELVALMPPMVWP